MGSHRTKSRPRLVSVWDSAKVGYERLGQLFSSHTRRCKETGDSQESNPKPKKIVEVILQIDYVENNKLPKFVQKFIWATYDETPDLPRIASQIEIMKSSEGVIIKNCLISTKPLGPTPTHYLKQKMIH